jgi:predicted component of type VI protein secretion system
MICVISLASKFLAVFVSMLERLLSLLLPTYDPRLFLVVVHPAGDLHRRLNLSIQASSQR